MGKFRGIQIRDGAITSNHLITGITVNGITLSGNAAQQKDFTVVNQVGLKANSDNQSYNLDLFFTKAGGTITGSVTVTGVITVSGSLVVPSGAAFALGDSVSGADILQALAGVDLAVTPSMLIMMTNSGTVTTQHIHNMSDLGGKEERMLFKTATQEQDSITLNYGDFTQIVLATGTGTVASDIEAYINGQLLEHDASSGFSFNTGNGVVTFNPSISGDKLSVVWRATTGTQAGGGGGGGGGGVQETIPLAQYAIEQDINAEFLPFTETDMRRLIKITQASTLGMMPISHYSDWLVHGKNLAKDILMRTSGSYFGVPTKLQGIFSGTTWTTGTVSKDWVLEFIAFCAAWAWKIRHPLLPTASGNTYSRLYKWETWDYLVEYLKPWTSYYVSEGWVNYGQPEVSLNSVNDLPNYIPKYIRLDDLTWDLLSKAGGQPFIQDMEINRLTAFGDVLATDGSTNKLIIRTEWGGVSSGFGNSTTIRSNEYLHTNQDTYFNTTLEYVDGNPTVSGNYLATGAFTPIYVKGQYWNPGLYSGPAVTHPAYHIATVDASNPTGDIALEQYATKPLFKVARIRHVSFQSNSMAKIERPFVRLGFVPEGLAEAAEQARYYGQSLAVQAASATRSNWQLVAKHILSLYPLGSGSLTINTIAGSYYYDNPLESDPNWIPANPELTSRYPTISGLTFSGSTYSPSSVPIKTGTYKTYTHADLIGFHPKLGDDILSYLWGHNESTAAGTYMIDGFLGDNYTIVM